MFLPSSPLFIIPDGYEIYTRPEKFIETKDALESLGYTEFIMSEVTFVPNNYVTLNEEQTEKVLGLVETLEDLDDVQNVYHNLDE